MKIAVASGKGGTGKTFVSTNMFRSLILHGINASLVDCDAEAPDDLAFFNARKKNETVVSQHIPVIDTEACTFCGKCHDYCSYNAIFIIPHAGIINVIEELCHDCGACSAACNFNAITEKEVPVGKVSTWENNDGSLIIEARTEPGVMSPVPVIRRAIKEAGNTKDVTILDSPPGTSCPFVHTAASADYVILVTEPTPFGLSDLKQSIATLQLINRKFGIIINRSDIGNNDLRKYLRDKNYPVLLEIPFQKRIAEQYSEGKIIAKSDKVFANQLFVTVKRITEEHGNSHNQR